MVAISVTAWFQKIGSRYSAITDVIPAINCGNHCRLRITGMPASTLLKVRTNVCTLL
jgi:hypothetical protein